MLPNPLGNGFGRKNGPSTGTLTKVWVNPTGRRPKVGGCTFDWTTVPVLGAPVTLPDESVIPIGTRYIRYGTFIARITANGDKQGMYGLYDASANDGRQLRTRGEIFFVEQNIFVDDADSLYVAGWEGGKVFKARMCIDDATNPTPPGFMTLANILSTFPQLTFAGSAV